LKYLSNKNGFLGIDNNTNFKEKVVVIPFGLEKTVSYGGGLEMDQKKLLKLLIRLNYTMKNYTVNLTKKLELKL